MLQQAADDAQASGEDVHRAVSKGHEKVHRLKPTVNYAHLAISAKRRATFILGPAASPL